MLRWRGLPAQALGAAPSVRRLSHRRFRSCSRVVVREPPEPLRHLALASRAFISAPVLRKWPCRRGPRWRLPRWRSRNRETCPSREPVAGGRAWPKGRRATRAISGNTAAPSLALPRAAVCTSSRLLRFVRAVQPSPQAPVALLELHRFLFLLAPSGLPEELVVFPWH